MEVSSVPTYGAKSAYPWSSSPTAENDQSCEETKTVEPQLIDVSFNLQMGYERTETNEVMAAPGMGIHFRPFFNLEFNYNLAIEILGSITAPEVRNPAEITQDLGVTYITALSEERDLNLGLRLAFSWTNALGEGIEHFIGGTAEIELGNYSSRFFLGYSFLNNLGDRNFHQATLGMRFFFEVH